MSSCRPPAHLGSHRSIAFPPATNTHWFTKQKINKRVLESRSMSPEPSRFACAWWLIGKQSWKAAARSTRGAVGAPHLGPRATALAHSSIWTPRFKSYLTGCSARDHCCPPFPACFPPFLAAQKEPKMSFVQPPKPPMGLNLSTLKFTAGKRFPTAGACSSHPTHDRHQHKQSLKKLMPSVTAALRMIKRGQIFIEFPPGCM